ncbi:hypothetical protein GCM10010985_32480 [Caballeronia grimmiae]|uniref:Uncharacterized protein n=1 Tax=Caballeronia grimmiae TaxID=1071679 RepID=A0ABQ1RPT2_9BURK|nr:hypothetical protein GCM10010985_32480 [Caballeronia grimmiae]
MLVAVESRDEERPQAVFRLLQDGSCIGETAGRRRSINAGRARAQSRHAAFWIDRSRVAEAVMPGNECRADSHDASPLRVAFYFVRALKMVTRELIYSWSCAPL